MATHMTTTGSLGGSGQREGLPATVIEDLLASPRRRKLLACLTERAEPVPVDDLASALTDADTAQSASGVDRARARQEIYQDLLPKLTATNVVHFDSMLGTVEFTGPEALSARLTALTNPCGESTDSGTKDK